MNPLKKLLGETGIYGGTTVVGRFLNWLLVPLYTRFFAEEEFGVVTVLLATVAVLQVLLTYGTETGFFRFASEKSLKERSFSTLLTSLMVTNTLFLILVVLFLSQIAKGLNIAGNEKFIILLAITLFVDIICSIPFAKLRLESKPLKFGMIKIVNILINISINLFFLLLCPWIAKNYPDASILKIYSREFGIGYIFVAYLAASVITLFLLIPEIVSVRFCFDKKLLQKILKYSFPILIVSFAGMVSLQADKTLLNLLLDPVVSLRQTGIYGANFKLAVIMTIFIQAFRYAYEPFFFSMGKNKDDRQLYADALKYFAIFGLLIFLSVMFYLDIIKNFIGKDYHEGLKIVPYVLLANLFMGMFYSLSLWYKLTDKTRYGAYLAVGGAVITVGLNFLLVPKIGYMGSAYAVLTCFVAMTIASYLLGQRHYHVKYDLKSIGFYFLLGLGFFVISEVLKPDVLSQRLLLNSGLLLVFLLIITGKEKIHHLFRG